MARTRNGLSLSLDRRLRFMARVAVSDGCWIWKLKPDDTGYGWFCFQYERMYAHRAAYELFTGPIPEGLVIDHLCRVHLCVNPDHLEAVTQKVNTMRGEAPGVLTYREGKCRRGHSMADAYVTRRKSGTRRTVCRKCAHAQQAAARRRRGIPARAERLAA